MTSTLNRPQRPGRGGRTRAPAHAGTPNARRLDAAIRGTWALTTVAAGGAMIGALSGGEVGPSARVVAPALLVMVLIDVLGPLAGAHVNSVVTLAFALRRAFSWRRAPGYWTTQVGGSVLAVILL